MIRNVVRLLRIETDHHLLWARLQVQLAVTWMLSVQFERVKMHMLAGAEWPHSSMYGQS